MDINLLLHSDHLSAATILGGASNQYNMVFNYDHNVVYLQQCHLK